jgi:hypothetical protein
MYEMLSNRPTSVSAVVEKFVSPISLDTVKVAVDAAVVVKLQDGEEYRSIVVIDPNQRSASVTARRSARSSPMTAFSSRRQDAFVSADSSESA